MGEITFNIDKITKNGQLSQNAHSNGHARKKSGPPIKKGATSLHWVGVRVEG